MDWACLLEKRGFPWGLRSNQLAPVGLFRLFQLIKKVSVSKSINLSIYQSISYK